MSRPVISALINTFNHERFIEQAIVSVLEQGLTASDLEIVVVDDGSTDRTPDIVQKFEPRVRLIRKKNGGQASAFNAGIAQTHADLIAFLDGDDWWAPGKLRAVLDVFEENRDIAAVGHAFYEVDEAGVPTDIFVPDKTRRLDLSSSESARVAELGRQLLGTSRLSVRRKILDQIGPLPLELIFCADTPILTLSLALGGAIVLDQPLCYYRVHSANLFAVNQQDQGRLRRKYGMLEFLQGYLTPRLAEFGVERSIVESLFGSDEIERERFRLQSQKQGRLATFRVELRNSRHSYRNSSTGYSMFKTAVALLALLLGPEHFYQIRKWYDIRGLRRFRETVGRGENAVPETMFRRIPVRRGD